VQKRPLIDTTNPVVGETFDAEFLDQLPLAQRDYQGVATLVPGVVDSTGTGNPSIMGGAYFNNTYKVDGFDTTDPVTHTFGQNFSFNAMAAEQVQTAAFGVEYVMRPGFGEKPRIEEMLITMPERCGTMIRPAARMQ